VPKDKRLQGELNSGKSLFLCCLIPLVRFHGEVQVSDGSAFNYQNCVGKSLNIFEEPRIGPSQVEHFKLIMEGAETTVKVKMTDDCPISRIPLFITTNLDLWHYAPQARDTLMARCYSYKVTRCDACDAQLKAKINSAMWFVLLRDWLSPVTRERTAHLCASLRKYQGQKRKAEEPAAETVTKRPCSPVVTGTPVCTTLTERDIPWKDQVKAAGKS
jgi:hypothetical protein